MQERVVTLGLITKEEIGKRRAFACVLLIAWMLIVPGVMLLWINGTRGHFDLWWQFYVLFLGAEFFDWLFIDTIWFGADGGYSFLSTLAEDNKLAVKSLEALEKNLRTRNKPLKIITGHTDWTDDLDFALLHRDELCKPFAKKYVDPSAPYDGYVEDDDTEEGARTRLLGKVKAK